MRSFLVAFAILLSVVVLILCNSAAVLHEIDGMLTLCREIASGSAPAAINELYAAWLDCRDFLSLSIHHSEIERAENALYSMASSRSDPAVMEAQLKIFTAVLHHIADSNRFDWSVII